MTVQWFAVHTKPRQEKTAEENLKRQEFTTYLPHIAVRKRREGKWTSIVEPLFPRYLFLQADPDRTNIAPVRSTLGVSGIVRFGSQLVAVPEQVIAYLRQGEDPATGLHYEEPPTLRAGDRVEILSGPFEGLSGIYKVTRGSERVAILLNVLGRQSEVVIKLDDIKRA